METRVMSKGVKRRLRRERRNQTQTGDFIPLKTTPAIPSAAPEVEQKPKMTKSAKRAARKRKKLAMLQQEVNEICSGSDRKPEVVIKKRKLNYSKSTEKSIELHLSGDENSILTKNSESQESENIHKQNINKTQDEIKHNNGEVLKEGANESPGKIAKPKKNLPPKKRRYVLFVGNLAYECKEEDIMEHFKRVGPIVSVRLAKHKDSNTSRGFCHLELGDEETYLKALSLHHSFLNKRRINVEYSSGQSEEKSVIKQKNMKLHTLNRTGQLGASKSNANRHAKKFKSKSVQKSRGEFFV